MKRRGAKVVSAASTVAAPTSAFSEAPPAHTTPAASPNAALDVVAATQPALTIPTLNIFARFQSKRDDFDADWLLLKEDPNTGDEKPPLASHVADKLKRHQAQLGAHRAAAAADRIAARSGQSNPCHDHDRAGAGGGAASAAVEVEAPSSRSRPRRPELYDSAEDERSVTNMPSSTDMVVEEATAAERLDSAGASVDDDEDGEYVPEDRKAAQYRHAATRKTRPAASPVVQAAAPPADDDAEVVAASAAADVELMEAVLEEGLTGDYLNFDSTTPTGVQAVEAGALQATIRMPGSAGTPSPVSSQQQQKQRQQQRGGQRGGGEAAPRVVVVPLWSAARMEQHGGYCRTSPLIALHQEMTDLVDYLRPTQAEISMRRYIEKEVGRLADRLWPGSRVLVYGSMYTQLLLPLSDLDMTLLDVPVPADEALTALAKEISNEGMCENAYPQVILKTKVPLIKFAHKGSLIDVDISVGAVDGKRNSDCVIRFLNTYPEAMPLVMVVKYFLTQRGMQEPYHGGLGSYAATLLVVAFLRQHPIYTTNPEQRVMTGLGKLFVDFLRMCGQFWNYARVAIALSDGGATTAAAQGGYASAPAGDFRLREDLEWGGRMQSPVSPSSPRTPMGPPQGSISDPVDASNNAASSLRLFHSVASMFTCAYQALTADFDAADAAAAAAAAASPELGASTAPSLQPSTPSCDDISRRPTLLSRIFHVDAEMVFRRQAIAATYARLCTEMPAYMEEVRSFRRDEDAAMLPSNGQSWRQRRQQQQQRRVAGGGDAGLGWGAQAARSVTSLEERLALAHLHRATSPPPPSPPPSKEGARAAAGGTADGSSRKRPHSMDEDRDDGTGSVGGSDSDVIQPRRRQRREGRDAYKRSVSASSSPSSSSSSSSSSGGSSDSGSNASSVRVDVTRETERRRRMRRH